MNSAAIEERSHLRRSRWAAIGAAVAVTLGGGGLWVAKAASSPGSLVVSITPVRILDTRSGVGLAGPFVSAVPRTLQVTGTVPTPFGNQTVVPAGATGVLLNVTVVGPTAAGFLSVRPGDAAGPASTSSLNFAANDIVPNAVQVALPVAGPGAGTIQITYDAFGAPGPTTEVLVDVVGYTTTLSLTDFYTRAEADNQFLEQAQPVVMTENPRSWAPIPALGVPAPTTVDYLGAFTQVTSNPTTFIWSSVTAPMSIGGTTYRLSSIEYCIEAIQSGASVDRVVLASNVSLLAGLQVVSAADTTVRTTTGCFSLSTNDGGAARSYGILVRFAGDPTKKVILGAVRSTWVPTTLAATTVESGGGSLLGD